MLLGSVTELQEGHRGQAVVVGSHGGCATGWHALRCGIAALLCHDAGIGFEEAGVQALRVLQAAGRPCAAIGHMSARIGDPEDMLERGRVSRLNSAAALLGVRPAMSGREALARLGAAPQPGAGPVEEEAPSFRRECRPGRGDGPRLVLLDSVSSVRPEDEGAILVTGSHGGLPGNAAGRALAVRPALAVFNDAGIGIDGAGTRRLAVLEGMGVAGACVDAGTARIGDARSTLETGRISALNRQAGQLGAMAGSALGAWLAAAGRSPNDERITT